MALVEETGLERRSLEEVHGSISGRRSGAR